MQLVLRSHVLLDDERADLLRSRTLPNQPMTSFLDAIALDEREHNVAARQAAVLATGRADRMFGAFVKSAGVDGLGHIAEELHGVVTAACEEVGHEDTDKTYATVMDYFTANYASPYPRADEVYGLGDDGKSYPVTARTASIIHEARKPKMCPFHRDVVDISLAAGDARAGFDSMAQHWGGPRHCDGADYEGTKCNFKPQMVTQAFWDDKAEKAEERKQQRAEQAEQQVENSDSEPVDTSDVEVETPEADVVTEPVDDSVSENNVVEVDFGGAGAEPAGETEVPMSMAASTKTADGTTGLGGPEPVMDKQKWTPQSVPFLDVDDKDGPHPTRHKDIVEPVKAQNADKLTEIGEQVTEHQDVAKDSGPKPGAGTETWTKGPATAVSSVIPADVDENPITALVNGAYDGFLPQHAVQQAITASRRR
jgi:hypothetical protein